MNDLENEVAEVVQVEQEFAVAPAKTEAPSVPIRRARIAGQDPTVITTAPRSMGEIPAEQRAVVAGEKVAPARANYIPPGYTAMMGDRPPWVPDRANYWPNEPPPGWRAAAPATPVPVSEPEQDEDGPEAGSADVSRTKPTRTRKKKHRRRARVAVTSPQE